MVVVCCWFLNLIDSKSIVAQAAWSSNLPLFTIVKTAACVDSWVAVFMSNDGTYFLCQTYIKQVLRGRRRISFFIASDVNVCWLIILLIRMLGN